MVALKGQDHAVEKKVVHLSLELVLFNLLDYQLDPAVKLVGQHLVMEILKHFEHPVRDSVLDFLVQGALVIGRVVVLDGLIQVLDVVLQLHVDDSRVVKNSRTQIHLLSFKYLNFIHMVDNLVPVQHV